MYACLLPSSLHTQRERGSSIKQLSSKRTYINQLASPNGTTQNVTKQGGLWIKDTHDVILSIRSVVSFKLTANNSCAMAGASSRNVAHCSFRRHHTTQSCSALTVAVRRVSLKKGNSPHGRPATISSKYCPWGSSYSARSIPDSNR